MVNRREIPQSNPPLNEPIVDSGGNITPRWARWLTNMFARQGGTQDDIYLLLFGLLTNATQTGSVLRNFDGLSDALATLQSLVYGRQDATAKIASLEDEIAALRAEVLARKAYDGQIEDLRVSVDTLRLQATDLQQRQQAIFKATDAAVTNAQTFSIGQAQTSFSQYTQLSATITGVSDNVSGLTTTNIPEGSRLYYTDARARASISATGPLSYNSSTGIMSITLATVATTGAYNDLSGRPTLGTAAAQNTGTSGANVPLLNGANTWSASQTFNGGIAVGSYTASPLAPITGYITIQDAAGNNRNIAVV